MLLEFVFSYTYRSVGILRGIVSGISLVGLGLAGVIPGLGIDVIGLLKDGLSVIFFNVFKGL